MTKTDPPKKRLSGIQSGLLASFLLGWAPILGKLAYQAHVQPLTLAALRTWVAATLLWLVYLLFWRDRLWLTIKDIFNCLAVGMFNGLGSLLYYNGLERIDASRAALLSALYPVWVVIYLAASGQPMRTLTLVRLGISLIGAAMVTSPSSITNVADYLGVMLMIASASINGWYLVMGQWVLADVPAHSATLYIITGMAFTVGIARTATGEPLQMISTSGWTAILALGFTTALSRMATFLSLEKLGSVQTAILSLTELAVSLTLAFIFLNDRLSWLQWLGAVLLLGGGIFARLDVEEDTTPPPFNPMDV